MSHAASLHGLIRKIDDPAVLRAQITLLKKLLEQDRQLEAEAIIPAIAEKLGELSRSAARISSQRERCRSILGEVSRATEQVFVQAGSVLNVVSATDSGSALYEAARKLSGSVGVCYTDAENIEQQLHEFDFDELAVNLGDLNTISGRIKGCSAYTENRRRWLIEKFCLIQKSLHIHAGHIATRQLLPMAAELYGKWRAATGDLAHLNALVQRPAPVVPDQLKKLLEELHESIDVPAAHLHTCINAMAQHQQLLLAEKAHIEAVSVLIELLTRPDAEHHEERQDQ